MSFDTFRETLEYADATCECLLPEGSWAIIKDTLFVYEYPRQAQVSLCDISSKDQFNIEIRAIMKFLGVQ